MRLKAVAASMFAVTMALSLTACGTATGETEADYSGQTITGEVTSVDGSSVTVTLGEWTEDEMASGDQSGEAPSGDQSGEAPSGDQSSDANAAGGEAPSGDQSSSDSTETPPEKPDGEDASGDQGGEAPSGDMGGDANAAGGEAPSGDQSSDANAAGGEAPSGDASGEAPSGDMSGEAPSGDAGGEAPSGDMGDMGGMSHGTFTADDDAESVTFDLADAVITEADGDEGTIDDIEADFIISITFDDNNEIESVTIVSEGSDSGSQSGQTSGDADQGTAANTIDTDGEYTDETYTSTGDDENALRVDGATVTLDGITVDKSSGSSSNTESGDFYGMNAALLATNGATVTIKDATVTSSAQNGNGVFSYGSGTTVNISDSTITTTADNSGGIMTTGGGTMNAEDLTVTTSGNSAAAIRTDRGGGTVNVTGGTYTSNGYNSPAIYSTAAVTADDAELTANNSEALVIEGSNSIDLTDCDVTGNMSDTEGTSSDENVHNVMIYQSMSGDANEGTSSFSMTGGSLTSENGDMIYVTNTKCTIDLSDVDIVNNDSDGALLRVTGNSASHGWGTAGSNGGDVTMKCDDQKLEGDIIVDSISKLNLTLSNGSKFTGTINIVDNEEGGTAVDDNVVVTIDSGCTWTLTGDCTITSLTNNGTINFNGYTITLADGTVLS